MDGHFRSFSFVDRITSVQPGVRICGRYQIPPGLADFSSSLVSESVGQLAAWSAMAALDFKFRPVAGIAAGIELLSAARPGQTLELAAEIESVETDAVGYSGEARVDSQPVVRLHHCVGPMLPMEDFDDPQAVRDRFQLLGNAGATPGTFGGVPEFPLQPLTREPGRSIRAALQVPTSASFFADHFPRRPVFPGTLLMNLNLRLAAELAAEISAPATGRRWKLQTVSDVKLRAFTEPGESLELEAKLTERTDGAATIAVETRKGKKRVGGARVQFVPEERS